MSRPPSAPLRLILSRIGQPQLGPRSRARSFATTPQPKADFTHAVIGGGAVGLAIARALQSQPGASTVLIERHRHLGSETSSRNSEVIHAGLYYGADSRKTRLCLQGKQQLYAYCAARGVPHANCGKWIVAQDDAQAAAVQEVHDFASSMGIPTRWLSRAEAERREPDVRAAAGALESSSTGIVDSHALMQALHADFTETLGGDVAVGAAVTGIEPLGPKRDGAGGWRIRTGSDEDGDSVTADTLVNSAGLAAIALSNLILPPPRRREAFYAKGNYYSYAAASPRPRTLIYPAPVPGHGGLGTHLTLDMAGRVRFGPDVEWVDSPADLSVSTAGLAQALDDIQSYLPGLKREAVEPDYCGIRPKLGKTSAVVSGKGFADFYIEREEGFVGFVNLLGIESPGLTSCLAIGEEVKGLLYR